MVFMQQPYLCGIFLIWGVFLFFLSPGLVIGKQDIWYLYACPVLFRLLCDGLAWSRLDLTDLDWS
jgi:hypothetical protein